VRGACEDLESTATKAKELESRREAIAVFRDGGFLNRLAGYSRQPTDVVAAARTPVVALAARAYLGKSVQDFRSPRVE